jgi:hypothetical protein
MGRAKTMNKSCVFLLVLFISSAFFGICIGVVWFEGYDPQEPQEILLYVEHKIPPVGRYTARPTCYLILSEAKPQIVSLTIIVTTYGLNNQSENFETWLSIDNQEPEKLFGTLHVRSGAFPFMGFSKRQYNVTLSELGDGVHLIKIRVAGEYYGGGSYDCEGNASFIFDTIPPKISILSIENKTYSADSIQLNFTTSEPVSQIIYSLDGQENVTINGNTTLTGLSEGDHNVTVYATDEAGKIGASETIYFRIEFLPTTFVVASLVTVAVIGIVLLLVYFKKHKH